MNKRNREQAAREKRGEKADRRAAREQDKRDRPPVAEGEDPDIAHIVPGPQPPTS